MIHTVTCRTENCSNGGEAIELYKPSETIICGVCGELITDITPEVPVGGYPEEE